MVSSGEGNAETRSRGAALRALRKRAGMTLAEAGDALEPAAISGQAWAIWEKGERDGIHTPAVLDRFLKAVQADREDFYEELRRMGAEPPAAAPQLPPGLAEPAVSYSVRVVNRAKPDTDRGTLVYERAPEGLADLAWLFGPTAGHLRMADDRLKGRVQAGQLIHYDRAMAPRTGQVCVVETSQGLHVYLYGELAGGRLSVEQTNPPAQVQFDLAEVRGVYAARLIGD